VRQIVFMPAVPNKAKTKRSPFSGYRAYVSRLQVLMNESNQGPDWNKQVDAALNGQASVELRRVAPLKTRRKYGAYFTGTILSERLLKRCQSFDNECVFYDPTCGMGDLLLAAAKNLPLGNTLSETLTMWGRRLAGSELRLESIEHDLYTIPSLRLDPISNQWRDYPKGTRLILRGLKDAWDAEAISQLRSDLALLVSPFQAPNDFSIEIETGQNWENLDGPVSVSPVLLDAANWKVVATLDEEDRVEIQMTSQRHETVYHFKPVIWSETIKRMGVRPHCGPIRMEFYFFVRRDAELAERTLRAKEITDFLKFNQGIRIYRDGFRVKPYGEPDGIGDWLRLAYRRTQNPEGVAQDAKPGNWRLGYNQVVGAVFISHEKNPGLDDQTNREGLLQGKPFDHLRAFSERVIQWFQIQHQTFEMGLKAVRIPAEQAEDKAKESIAGAGDSDCPSRHA
jgi:hypothetical protein